MGTIGYRDSGATIEELARTNYDVAIVGGGIFGAMLHLEAARAGLRSVLVERDDFGAATSQNSLRIVHGGLRYLKSMNVARSVVSTRERQWYLSSLERLVAPLPCLLPIYARDRKQAALLKLGLAANDALSEAVMYLDGALADVPHGEMLDAHEVRELAPCIPDAGLVAGARWHDLTLRCPGRVIVEALKWAAELGGVAANYVEAQRLFVSHGRVRGVGVVAADGASAELRARVVVNATGPWAGELAARWGGPEPRIEPLVAAWNVLLDRPALSEHAVALQDSAAPSSGLKFATSLGGRLLVGTGYAALTGSCETAEDVVDGELDAFIAAVNRCVPTLAASRRDVLRVYCGVLPAASRGSSVPRARDLVMRRGPAGLITVSGSKFTTARAAARRALAAIRRGGDLRWPTMPPRDYPPCYATTADGLFRAEWTMLDVEARRAGLQRIVAREAVEHLDDLVLRRTTLGDQPLRALAAARGLCGLDERWVKRADAEAARLAARLGLRRTAWGSSTRGECNPQPVARTA